ncbi:MAG: cation transporter [Urechidicola sp.]|nr:cation transporter [Urechidicola sp.]
MKKLILLSAIILMAIPTSAQKKNAKVQFEVAGICGMCKQRIEKAALNTKGVKSASWSVETHQLILIIDERKTSPLIIKKTLAAVGHSTKEVETTEEAYDKLDSCCKYNDEEVINNHK